MKFLESKKNKFLEGYTIRLLHCAYLVADIEKRDGIDEDAFNLRVLKCLRGEDWKE